MFVAVIEPGGALELILNVYFDVMTGPTSNH